MAKSPPFPSVRGCHSEPEELKFLQMSGPVWCAYILVWRILAGNLESCSGLLWCSSSHLCMLSLFSRVRLCDPVYCSSPGSSVHGILQARILEWVAISSSRDLPDPGVELESHVSCIGGQVPIPQASYIGPHFPSRSAVSPVPRWHLNHLWRTPPSLQHLAGGFADGRASWEMLEPGPVTGWTAECLWGWYWVTKRISCWPALCGLRSHRSWQTVAALTARQPRVDARPQPLLLDTSSDSESWAFQLMLLPREMGAAGSAAGVWRQPMAWEETCCKKSVKSAPANAQTQLALKAQEKAEESSRARGHGTKSLRKRSENTGLTLWLWAAHETQFLLGF